MRKQINHADQKVQSLWDTAMNLAGVMDGSLVTKIEIVLEVNAPPTITVTTIGSAQDPDGSA